MPIELMNVAMTVLSLFAALRMAAAVSGASVASTGM